MYDAVSAVSDPVLDCSETSWSCVVSSDAGHEFLMQFARELNAQRKFLNA
jgi:hypothetical protein